ncbi:MAG TPA: M28 family peptidase [Gammaproteobacteria bacterium]|nr:M28 family peptidase [Gammaproteobacteria bacterium]HIK69203.1 M28 family peptidase [Pseudomonadales bacterium]
MLIDLTSAAEIGDGRRETSRLFPVWLSPVFLGLLTLLGNLSFSQASDEKLFAMAQAVSAERIERDVNMLAGFGTRHSLSDTRSQDRGIGAARRWIEAEFALISKRCGGCLEVQIQQQVFAGERRIPEATEVVNVIAILRGTQEPQRYVIMSGDIDSRVSDPMDSTSDSPGANDNASGMAGTLEAARLLSQYRFPASIVFAGLSGEEQGLFGGQILAAHAKQQDWYVQGVLNNDMIGNIAGLNGVINNTTARVFSEGTRPSESSAEARIRRFTGGEVDSPSRNLARYIDRMADTYLANLDIMMIYRLDRFGRGGHHRPFNDLGFPAVRIMETNEHYHRQHQDLRIENGIRFGDEIAGVNFEYAAKLTALNVVTLASMAWAPAPPEAVEIEGMVSANTTLKWRKVIGAVAYKVYWRLTTEPQWHWFRALGNVDSVTLENIVIDNYFFGVASVNEDGIESPVVFPGPIGRFKR